MAPSIATFRGKRRLFLTGILFFVWCIYIYSLKGLSYSHDGIHTSISTNQTQFKKQHGYFNLNDDRNNRKNPQHVLVLTHLQNHETYLDHYFELLDKSSYTNKYISIGLLVTDSTDNTLLEVYQHIGRLQNRWRNQFYSIEVYQKDFGFNRKARSLTTLARARNFLLSLTLKDYHNFVFWVDVELYSYPKTIFNDFVLMNLDVVVPNCFKKRNDNLLEGYDLSNWQESDESLRYQQQLLLNQVLIKGKKKKKEL